MAVKCIVVVALAVVVVAVVTVVEAVLVSTLVILIFHLVVAPEKCHYKQVIAGNFLVFVLHGFLVFINFHTSKMMEKSQYFPFFAKEQKCL